MTRAIAILSMLHEPAAASAQRMFRGQPVLRWTVQRLQRARKLDALAVICWDDQLEAVCPISEEMGATIVGKGPRGAIAEMDAVTAARRWADGWRGGLLSTCHFDLGFHAPWHHELSVRMDADAAILVDPSAALIDPEMIDAMVDHAEANAESELCFMPAALGLGAVLLHTTLLKRLATARTHAGRLMHYHPDQLSREPLASQNCVSIPVSVARTPDRFTLDSDRQVRRIENAMEALNGQLMSSNAEELVRRARSYSAPDPLPREVVLELNTRRSTHPVYWPGSTLAINRPDFSLDQARALFAELSLLDHTRLTLAGVGDPLLGPDIFTIIDAAKLEGRVSVHVETDLLDVSPEHIARLAASPVDIISVNLPAMSQLMYAKVMGCDGFARVLENIRRLLAERQSRQSLLPIIVPIFTKCRENFVEMEAWYDHWIRTLGSAVIRGPSDYCGQIPDVAIADMAPSGRKPCARIASRLTILSDGRIVSCEQDVNGIKAMGQIGEDSLRDIWQWQFESLRRDHRQAKWTTNSLCGRCREWNRA